MNASSDLWSKLSRNRKYRHAFVASQLKRGIPTQLRAMLKQRGWSQAVLAELSGVTQGAISRACDPDYGNLTFNNVLKIAAGCDVAFIGRFVPFSELTSWYKSVNSEQDLMVPSFEEDENPQAHSDGQTISVITAVPFFASLSPSVQNYNRRINETNAANNKQTENSILRQSKMEALLRGTSVSAGMIKLGDLMSGKFSLQQALSPPGGSYSSIMDTVPLNAGSMGMPSDRQRGPRLITSKGPMGDIGKAPIFQEEIAA